MRRNSDAGSHTSPHPVGRQDPGENRDFVFLTAASGYKMGSSTAPPAVQDFILKLNSGNLKDTEIIAVKLYSISNVFALHRLSQW